MSFVSITNNTKAPIHLPAVSKEAPVTDAQGKVVKDDRGRTVVETVWSHTGVTLVPGRNNVPTEYLDHISSLPKNHGLRKALNDLTGDNTDAGARVAIASPEENAAELAKPEGVPAPLSLKELSEERALSYIKLTDDPVALKRWSRDPRKAVSTAAKERIKL